MSRLLVITLDADVAGHLAVALRRHRSALRQNGLAEPSEIAELETAAMQVVSAIQHPPSVAKRQQASASRTIGTMPEAGSRDYLTRSDVHHLAGVSLATVDRWIATGNLPSTRRGRVRRIARTDLDAFLNAAA